MGARSKRDQKRRRGDGQLRKQHPPQVPSEVLATADLDCATVTQGKQAQLPSCVHKLNSSEYAEMEDACMDVAFFALQPSHHAQLLRGGVPQRLAELLCMFPMDPNQATEEGVSPRLHPGILYLQVAAAEALRNLITNSDADEVVDTLTAIPAFVSGLVDAVFAAWERVKVARRTATPDNWNLEEPSASAVTEEEDVAASHDQRKAMSDTTAASSRHTLSSSSMYMTLMRFLEELLQVVFVCVEGSESFASIFNFPNVLLALLDILQSTVSVSWDNLQHAADYYRSNTTDLAGVRLYKRRETERLASVAVAVSDVLHVLSADNPVLAALLTDSSSGNGISGDQQVFLNSVLDAVHLQEWLSVAFAELPVTPEQVDVASVVQLEKDIVVHHLLQTSLTMQGVLLHTVPSADNVKRVLPLIVTVLGQVLPIQTWRNTLPLLVESCSASEEVRKSLVSLVTRRLRAAQVAVKVFHTIVGFICESNDSSEDDESAFRNNPLSPILFQSNALFIFGRLLKDALWIPMEGSCGVEGNTAQDVMLREEQSLRGAALSNAEVTTLQFLILSIEAAVWGVASTLLMMVPVSSLGDPPLVWQAMVTAVQRRYELINAAAQKEAEMAEHQRLMDSNNPDQHLPLAADEAAYNIATHSPAARQLLWLQLESLAQMLWTLQRSQAKNCGGVLLSQNQLGALSSHVDLLIRLSWERKGSPALQQSCVGAVGLLCSSMKTTEATEVATRYALAVLGSNESLLQLNNGIVQSTAPTQPAERARWLASLASADGIVSVRCEAANTLMDLFLDERDNYSVYAPLQVHTRLQSFLPQLRGYIKRRVQLAKDLKRHYRMVADAGDLSQWEEVADNLGEFLKYKVSEMGTSGRS